MKDKTYGRKIVKGNRDEVVKRLYISWGVCLLIGFTIGCILTSCSSKYDEVPNEEVYIEEDDFELIRWKQETEEVHVEELDVEELDVEPVAEPQKEYELYDVPLSEELQIHVIEECEKRSISPSIVIAMIERESDFRIDLIGDNGDSYGLMQIQPKWHQNRMEKLGCTDLLDPFQNITVGIDYLAELKDENPDLYWVLMAYNGGRAYANRKMDSNNYSDYAVKVIKRASEL